MKMKTPHNCLILIFNLLIFTNISMNSYASEKINSANAINKLPPNVRENLETQTEAIISLSIEFQTLRQGIGENDYDTPTYYMAEFATNRLYAAWTNFWRVPQPKKIFRRQKTNVFSVKREVAYDGKIFYSGTPRQMPAYPDAHLEKFLSANTSDQEANEALLEVPYLEAAGFFVPKKIKHLQKFSSVEPLVLFYHREGYFPEITKEGNNLRITFTVPDEYLSQAHDIDLRNFEKNRLGSQPLKSLKQQKELYTHLQDLSPRRIVSFLLDPTRKFITIEREERTAKGEKIVRIIPAEWNYYDEAGIWLPRKCIETYYTNPWILKNFVEEPVMTITHELVYMQFDCKRNNFTLEYNLPGTSVIDRTLPETRGKPSDKIGYRIPLSEKELRERAKKAQGSITTQRKITFIIVLILVLCLPLLYRWKFHR